MTKAETSRILDLFNINSLLQKLITCPAIARDGILESDADSVARYKGGETKLMGFFVGQVMKATRGQGNPKVINQLLREKLNA